MLVWSNVFYIFLMLFVLLFGAVLTKSCSISDAHAATPPHYRHEAPLPTPPPTKENTPHQELGIVLRKCAALANNPNFLILCTIEEAELPNEEGAEPATTKHPTIILVLQNPEMMIALLEPLRNNLTLPFCRAHNTLGNDAYLIVSFVELRAFSVVSCKTGEESPLIPWGNEFQEDHAPEPEFRPQHLETPI